MANQFVGVAQAMAKLEKAKKLVHGNIAGTKRRIVKAVLTDLVSHSPQWSGNLASNWFVEHTGVPKGRYTELPGYQPPALWEGGGEHFQMGHRDAIDRVLQRELPRVAAIKWNSKVVITNYAGYASDVERGIGPTDNQGVEHAIRPENILARYGAVAMVGYASMKYNNLRYLKNLAE